MSCRRLGCLLLLCLIILPQEKEANQISTPKTTPSELDDVTAATSNNTTEAGQGKKPRRKDKKKVDLSSPFLPDNLPEGDPVHYALPVFLEEPQDTFLVKSKPGELRCRVAHALSVHVQCQDEVQQQAVTSEHVDPETGIRITEARATITRNQVEEFFGDYHCACVAVSGQGAIKSRLALVTTAFLKKEFETPPYSHQSLEGKQLELRCYPPRGKPEPTIYWLKNDQLLDESDSNYIVTQEGHLIIVHSELADSGNYTCVAKNIAAERRSEPAEISIYVSGGWSAWSAWSSCQGSCGGAGLRRRSRVCRGQEQGGRGQARCPGQPAQTRSCDPDCSAAHGLWSPWSAWSACTTDCRQSRRRSCPGLNPGLCFGLDEDSQTCAGGRCKAAAETAAPAPATSSAAAAVSSSEVALYVGLSLAVAVFLVVLLVALSLLRRRRLPGGYRLTQSAYEAEQRKKMFLGSGSLGAVSPGNTELTSVCYEYSSCYPDTHNKHNNNTAVYSIDTEHHYEQPMVVLPSRSPVDSIVKPLISDTSSSSTGGNISPRSAGTFDRSPAAAPAPPARQLAAESAFTRWSSVTSAGARLSLGTESGISLTVPEGALAPGNTADMFVSVCHDTKSAPGPALQPGSTLLSPVVVCGPAAASKKLRKPVIVSFPHCAALRQGNWTLTVVGAGEGGEWRPLVTLGQETINSAVYAQLDLNMLHLVTDSLSAFALVGSSAHAAPAYKSLRIAAFGAEVVPGGGELSVRLYCLQDTDHALRFVTETERQFGGRLLDAPVSTLLQYGGHNLRLQLERLGEGWSVGAGAEVQEVPFPHLWGVSNPSLHCSFTLRPQAAPGLAGPRSLAMAVNIHQEGNTHKCLLKISTHISPHSAGSGGRGGQQRPSSSGCSSSDSYSSAATFRLPAATKETLVRMLDAPVSLGNDWRLLAERLNVHRYIAFFATRPSPTEAILNLWEARNRESSATAGLLNILRGMGRFDAAHLLEHDLQLS